MKATILFTIVILLAIACGKERCPLLDMTILVDATDEIHPLSYEDVRQFLEYSDRELLWYEVSIRRRELTDVRYGSQSESHLPVGEPNTINEAQRKLAVKRFLKQTETMINQEVFNGDKEQSHLYFGIAEELNRLSKRRAIQKVAVISSNLLENTNAFSVYRPNDRTLLLEQPDSVIRILEGELTLEDLSRITVYIVYQANPADHELFTAMSTVYRTMLTRKGAQVHIAGNLIPQTFTTP